MLVIANVTCCTHINTPRQSLSVHSNQDHADSESLSSHPTQQLCSHPKPCIAQATSFDYLQYEVLKVWRWGTRQCI